MGFDLTSVLAGVSSLDTGVGKKQIEYIDLDRLHPDPNNFYELKGIEELAGNIELLGLQQPVLVRKVADGYMIVSGHRRTAALRMLVEDGREDLRQVPCIVEAAASSPELQELRLIYANSDTRTMSSAELSRQAERVEMLLYQLKEQGIEFPGRMRDHVAEACKMSKSKLARLKVIREKLVLELRINAYEKGLIGETVAYALAQQPEEVQRYIAKIIRETGKEFKDLQEWKVKSMAEDYERFSNLTCTGDLCGGKCSHVDALMKKLYSGYGRDYCYCGRACCSTCPDIGNCKNVCPAMQDSAKAAKAAAKEKRAKEKAEQAERDRVPIEQITKIWKRFAEARIAAAMDTKEFCDAIHIWCVQQDVLSREAMELGHNIKPDSSLPYGYRVDLRAVLDLTRAAAALGCSIDYLLCRTDVPELAELEGEND